MRLLFTKSSSLALFLSLAWFAAGCRTAPAGHKIATGPFQPTWESLKQYEAPEWYRDAKFSIWAHWGPQCEPEQGDWYARNMYIQGTEQNKFHVAHYGPPSKFGFKDVIHEWKAENWDPDKLMALYKRAGAVGGIILSQVIGTILQSTGGNYVPIFVIAACTYLSALLIIHILAPRLAPADL